MVVGNVCQKWKVTLLQVRLVTDPVYQIQVAGEVDLASVRELTPVLDRAVAESPRGIVLDMTDTTYVDSAGLAAILSAYQRLRTSGGRIALVVTNPMLREIFDIIHIESFPGIVLCQDAATAQEAIEEQKEATV